MLSLFRCKNQANEIGSFDSPCYSLAEACAFPRPPTSITVVGREDAWLGTESDRKLLDAWDALREPWSVAGRNLRSRLGMN